MKNIMIKITRLLSKLKERNGSILAISMMMAAIFVPLIISGIMDINRLGGISKRLKNSLAVSVKGGALQLDKDYVPEGIFVLDPDEAEKTVVELMSRNLNMSFTKISDYYEAVSSESGRKVYLYVTVYNNRHENDFVTFPNPGTIPIEVTRSDIQIQVDRPTVFAVALYTYQTLPLLGSQELDIIRFASAQLND